MRGRIFYVTIVSYMYMYISHMFILCGSGDSPNQAFLFLNYTTISFFTILPHIIFSFLLPSIEIVGYFCMVEIFVFFVSVRNYIFWHNRFNVLILSCTNIWVVRTKFVPTKITRYTIATAI